MADLRVRINYPVKLNEEMEENTQQNNVKMEILIMEMDAALHALSRQILLVQEVQPQALILALIVKLMEDLRVLISLAAKLSVEMEESILVSNVKTAITVMEMVEALFA